jgi:ABC-type lipoprotein release transport system permease subunit
MSLNEIEEKICELSIFRILGLQKVNVLLILLFQGLSQAIPGLIIGIILTILLRIVIAK